MADNFILEIYKNPQTVFTFKEISLFFPNLEYRSLKNKLYYAVSTHKLIKLRKGLYAKENFDFLEAAAKVYTPSYIGLETILQKEGIVFQVYDTIFAISYLTRKIKIAGRGIFYRKMRMNILLNDNGIIREGNFCRASAERAFLDAVFLYKDYHFDNLKSLDWGKIEKMKKIYNSRSLEKRINQYHKIFKNADD